MVVGLRRRRPYDVLWMHGTDDAIGGDVLFKGTALSAPVSMLLTQTAMTAAERHASHLAPQHRSSWLAILAACRPGSRPSVPRLLGFADKTRLLPVCSAAAP
jgi:hypothetical protein